MIKIPDLLTHIIRCARLLSPRARISYTLAIFFQSFISLLDLIGLALIMKVILSYQTSNTTNPISGFNIFPIMDQIIYQFDLNYLLLIVVCVFILKGILALLLHSVVVHIMERETMRLVKRLLELIFANRTSRFRKLTTQDISFSIQNATEIVFKETLVPMSIIISDGVLIFLISLNLFFSAKILFFPMISYFFLIFLALRSFEKRSLGQAYKSQWTSEVQSRSYIDETASSLRELYASSKLNWMLEKIQESRKIGIRAGAIASIAQLRPKYFYEMAFFGGIGIMAYVSIYLKKDELIISLLALFVISASRMIPSLLRLQFYLGLIQKSNEQSARVFEILDTEFEKGTPLHSKSSCVDSPEVFDRFQPEITVRQLTFSYEINDEVKTITDLNFEIKPGEVIALVGPSGSGKSTIVDLILGYQSPGSGSVQISGLNPRIAFEKWPGNVAYVPQRVTIYQGSLFSNIAVGDSNSLDEASREKVVELLKIVGLTEFLFDLSNGIDTQLSEMGSNLSGGQIQRIGIARALHSNPKIIVLDESTSALDSYSESEIMDLLLSFRGEKTMIFVAHRLSTIKTADRIFYVNNGVIEAKGTFTELRDLVPDFNRQVEILNINR
jgi:ABC-type bacteriocin/lantibiotic exporter with double-glycine peptidase domain